MNTQPDYTTDIDMAVATGHFTHMLAGRAATSAEQAWKRQAVQLLATMPNANALACFAEVCSLSALRLLVNNPSNAVRLACTSNLFAIDVDIQCALAGDTNPEIVIALLHQVDLCLDAVEVVIAGPHSSAQRALAGRRNMPAELVRRLLTSTGSRRRTRVAAKRPTAQRIAG